MTFGRWYLGSRRIRHLGDGPFRGRVGFMVPAKIVSKCLPGVVSWAAFSPGHKVELRSHAVETSDGWLVFDPIPLESGWPAEFGPVRAVILTNGNHGRDSDRWAAAGVPVWAPAGIGVPDAHPTHRYLPGGREVSGAVPVPLPGGGPGETAWSFPGRSLVVFGDALVNLPDRGLETLPAKYCSDPELLRRSLRGGLPGEFENAVFAHGDPILGGAAGRIRALPGD